MKHKVLLLSGRDIARLMDVKTAIRVVREAFKAQARGQTVMPPKLYLPLPGGDDFRAMPAYLAHPPACGMKWVNVHPRNPSKGLPTVMAIIVLNDPSTGVPLAVMDGRLITKLRTAASAAVAAKVLARKNSRVIGLVGCGAQGDAQLLAHAALFPVTRIKVWGHFRGEAARFIRRMRRQLPGVAWQACDTIESCARNVGILITGTPSRTPLVKRAWIAPGTHINAIGADAPGKQELDPQILRDALVVVDDRTQAVHSGEINVPVSQGRFAPRQIHATLGEILIGRKAGRRNPSQITLFDCTGLAIHDVAAGAEVVRLARQHRLGRRLAFFS